MKIDDMPQIDGAKATPHRLVEHIRTHLDRFVDSSNTLFEPWDESDATRWVGDSPEKTVFRLTIHLATLPVEYAAIVCSEHDPLHWRFSTLETTWPVGQHPVSGTREFGIEEVEDGFVFYTRAADRATFLPPPMDWAVFDGADRLWRSLQSLVADYVNTNGGTASVVAPFSVQFAYSALLAVPRSLYTA